MAPYMKGDSMRYLREHFNLITKLFVNQIGMTIFGMILTMAVMKAAEDNPTLHMLVSLFAILFYLCLIYNVMWEAGARNIIRINAGRMPKDRAFALKAAFFASVPNLVLAVFLAISYLLAYPLGVAAFAGVQDAFHLILGIFEAMYLGLFNVILSTCTSDAMKDLWATVLYLASSLPMILVSMGAYALGTRNVHLLGKREPKSKKITKD